MKTAMYCIEVQQQISAYREAGEPLTSIARQHLGECGMCRHRHADAVLDRMLQSQPVAPPTAGFFDKSILGATQHRARPRRWATGLAASVLAAVLVAGLHFTMQGSESGRSEPVQISLVPQQAKTVRVLINSASSRDSATITIALAENLELEGFPDEHVIEWQTSLEQGNNLLALPLRLKNAEGSHFDVAFSHGQTLKKVRFDVSVANQSSATSHI